MKTYKNFTQTAAFPELQKVFASPLPHLKTLQNTTDFIQTDRYIFDYSKTHFSLGKTLFEALLDELEFDRQRKALFGGKKVNVTENRAALHTALRIPEGSRLFPDENVKSFVIALRRKIKDFTTRFRNGELKGITGKTLDTVVNIGIGGSHLGPQTVVHALKNESSARYFFLSNVDDRHLKDILDQIDLERTLFVVVSKSFSTKETLYNASYLKKILEDRYGNEAVSGHFIAVSSNKDKAVHFGIAPDHIFDMPGWAGGRFSLWSAAGISIPLILGYGVFERLLAGAHEADLHFANKPPLENIPVIMALLTMVYNNFAGYESEAHIPYEERLFYFPFYLQQLAMESNGKSVQRNGDPVRYQTGNIVWGATGTNAQHSFFQLLHQGTKTAPVYFTGYVNPDTGILRNRRFLLSNLLAQSEGLALGKDSVNSFEVFEGNRPSVTFLFDEPAPENLGFLLAVFEHKIFTESILWNINAFDQPGVELGKKIALQYEKRLENKEDYDNPVYRFIKDKL